MPPQRRGARKIAPVIINTPAFFGPFGETGITPSTQCSSAPLPEVRCYVPTVVESGTPRVGGRWSASIVPGQSRALRQGQGAVAHRSPRWPRSPSPWQRRIVGSPPTGWPPTVNQDGTCKLRCAELTPSADGPYRQSQARLFGRPRTLSPPHYVRRCAFRNRPVCEALHFATSSGAPATTTVPPAWPPSGPRSMT